MRTQQEPQQRTVVEHQGRGSRSYKVDLDPETNPTLTVDQTAVVLDVARTSVYGGIKSGDIPSIRVGRRILVPTAALRRMLALDDPQSAA